MPIPGASVRVKDTAAEAWTNARGEYKFVMPEASEILVISAKGYRTVEVPVTKEEGLQRHPGKINTDSISSQGLIFINETIVKD